MNLQTKILNISRSLAKISEEIPAYQWEELARRLTQKEVANLESLAAPLAPTIIGRTPLYSMKHRYLSDTEWGGIVIFPVLVSASNFPKYPAYAGIYNLEVKPESGVIKIHDLLALIPGTYFLVLQESPTIFHLFKMSLGDAQRGIVRFSNRLKPSITEQILRGDEEWTPKEGEEIFERYEFKLGDKPGMVSAYGKLLYTPSENFVFQN